MPASPSPAPPRAPAHPVLAIAAMVAGSALLTANDAVTKWLTQSYPVTQVWCLRTVFVIAVILALAPRFGGYAALVPRRLGAQALRAGLFVATSLLIVTGLSLMPLALMVALVLASPLFVAALSPLLLGERTGPQRWVAVAAGFAGMLLIVRPGTAGIGAAALLGVAAALGAALRDLVTRRISVTESSLSILLWSSVAVVAIGLAGAPWLGWAPVGARDWGLLAFNGALNGGAHFLVIEALRLGEASTVAPYKYTALLFGGLFGFVLWGDVPAPSAIAGMALIAASGLYLLRVARRSRIAKG